MNRSEILQRITDIVREELDDDDIHLSEDMKASEIEDWDSLAHVRIVVAVEGEFGCRFATGEITSLDNIGDLVTLVEKHAG